MKKTKIIVLGFLLLSMLSLYSQDVTRTDIIIHPKEKLNTEIDSVSYALGLSMSQQLNLNAKEVDLDVFIQGFLEGKKNDDLLIEVKEIRNLLSNYFKKKQEKEFEEKYGEYKRANEKFLIENKNKAGVKITPSGLQYLILKEGQGTSPIKTSKVKVHYKGALIDGTIFDSSIDRGEPTEFGVGQVIRGWTEGLQLMKLGAKYKFFIPQELAYGSRETRGKIKPYSTLIFEVELLEIK